MRVLITGSRTWSRTTLIWTQLYALAIQAYGDYDGGHQLTVVHGDCPKGADLIAKAWVQAQHPAVWEPVVITQELHPANWALLGPRAGPIRNQGMVDLGADLCLAFMMPGSSPGTADCIARAQAAGIETRIFRGEQDDQ